ncbi:MAG: LPXTG cell wall anchor domain-containing protein [Microbacteriaceae bacterium]|nr:LPXTG cell wall anchor domain-containing protein [Microbacteriaceae bacterium]
MRGLGGILAAAGAIIIGLGAGAAPAAAAPPTPPPGGSGDFDIVSLGDSYSAGFGILPFLQDSPFPGTVTEGGVTLNGCYQAEADYPHQVAGLLGFPLDDQTCSGAVTANLTTTPQTTMVGQLAPAVQAAALSAQTDVVTLTIGGNDLLFSTIAEHCIRLSESDAPISLLFYSPTVSSCEQFYTAPAGTYSYTSDGTTYTNINVDELLTGTVVPALTATYAAIAAAAPNAEVFVVGYPQIATSDSTKAASCYSLDSDTAPVDAVPFGPSDILWLSQVEHALVDQIESLTAAAGTRFHYVDGWTPSAEHTLCDGADSWITAMSGQIGYGLDCDMLTQQPLVYDGTTVGCLDLGALHPNGAGVAALTGTVSDGILAGFGDGLRLVAGETPKAGETLTIAGFGFPAGAPVELVLHSDPVPLGAVTASSLGTFSATVTIPAGVSGAHELVATSGATSYALPLAFAAQLAATGDAETDAALLIGLCLLTTGFLMVVARRRTAASR